MREEKECVWNPKVFQDDGQQDIMDIISHNFLKILKVNLTNNTYQNIMVEADELQREKGYTEKLSDWFVRFAEAGYVSKEDQETYLSFCDLDHLRTQFKAGNRFICCHYRRKVKEEFHWVSMELVPGKEYREDDQVVFLCVRDIHEDYLQQVNFTVRRAKNALSIVNLNLTGNAYGSGCGDYASLIMDTPECSADAYLDSLSGFVLGKEAKREFRERISRKNLLRCFEKGETPVTFVGAFMLEKDKRRTLEFTAAMDRNAFTGDVEAVLYTMDVTSFSEKDTLTGGLNQQGFIRNVQQLIKKQEQKEKYAILCLDVNGFKAINELFGILEGNDLLRELYRSLESSFMEPVIIARAEADQYLCLVEWDKLDYEKLVSWCEEDYCIKGRRFRVSKRCGIYLIRDNTMAVRSMCDRARLALSIAKSERSIKPYVIFDDTMNEAYIDRSEILGQFDSSLKNGEFSVYLQPVVDPVSGQISSAEALVRWNHPAKGFISPQQFIPVLEGNGDISRLDLYVVREVEKFQRERERQRLTVVPVSVNLSWLDFYDDELMEWLHGYVRSQKGKKHTIRFEITESSYAAVTENRSLLFKRIRQHGAELLLDDFGSGYSSFSTLQNYDFDILKIDIGFVKRIEQEDKTKSIIESIIKMVHQMDARVVAEGAETLKQVEFLRERGCDYVQGYYFYKPMTMERFAAVLDS